MRKTIGDFYDLVSLEELTHTINTLKENYLLHADVDRITLTNNVLIADKLKEFCEKLHAKHLSDAEPVRHQLEFFKTGSY